MKKKINAIIVVEGKTDIDFLSSFIDSEFVITNGSCVPRETISYLKTASKYKDIIVLTDPDFPGKRIRELLNENIPNLFNAYIDKTVSIKNNKVGVAESTKEEILKALNNLELRLTTNKNNIKTSDLFNLGYIGKDYSSDLRNDFSKKYSIGLNNGKSFLKRINNLKIDIETLIDFKEKWKKQNYLKP